MPELVDVYPYRRVPGFIEVLIFKRAADVAYPNCWRMIGGKIEPDEQAWKAAMRELREETGCNPETFWTIPSVNCFYSADDDRLYHIPAFAAELSPENAVRLHHEHSEYKWVKRDQLDSYLYWPEQIRLYKLMIGILKKTKKIPDEWIIKD